MALHHRRYPFSRKCDCLDSNSEHFSIGRRLARSAIRRSERRGELTPDLIETKLRGIDQAKRDYKTVFKRDKDTVPMLQDYDGQRYELLLKLRKMKKGGR